MLGSPPKRWVNRCRGPPRLWAERLGLPRRGSWSIRWGAGRHQLTHGEIQLQQNPLGKSRALELVDGATNGSPMNCWKNLIWLWVKP